MATAITMKTQVQKRHHLSVGNLAPDLEAPALIVHILGTLWLFNIESQILPYTGYLFCKVLVVMKFLKLKNINGKVHREFNSCARPIENVSFVSLLNRR